MIELNLYWGVSEHLELWMCLSGARVDVVCSGGGGEGGDGGLAGHLDAEQVEQAVVPAAG